MRLYDLITTTCDAAIDQLQRADGSFPAGHNGPYNDTETPVRNTSHWVISLCKAYEITGDDTYRDAALQAVDYLLGEEARPHGETFHHRSIEGKDRCNGLIGQAWTIEALATAGHALEYDPAVTAACSVFNSHPFLSDLGLWQRIKVDGSVLSIDRTFNHQLWFAAAGGLLRHDDSTIETQVQRFLERIPQNLRTYDSGLVYHPLCPMDPLATYLSHLRNKQKRPLLRSLLVHAFRPPNSRTTIKRKAIGYHSFNTYALAMLREAFPDVDVWRQPPVIETIEYLSSGAYLNSLEESAYAFPYNAPGFEVPYSLEIFDAEDESIVDQLWKTQLEGVQSDKLPLFQDAPDPHTLTARLYEATRHRDRELYSI